MAAIAEVVSEYGRFGPLPEGDPSVGRICPGCETPMRVGDRPSLVNPSPPPEDAGAFYNAEVQIAHEDCAFVNGLPVVASPELNR